jgi:hypothetical protein
MSYPCNNFKLEYQKDIPTTTAEEIVIQCIQSFKNVNQKMNELDHFGIRLLFYYATPANRVATANYYDDYFLEDDLPETYKKFILTHHMFQPLLKATDFKIFEKIGDTSQNCTCVIKSRIYFVNQNDNNIEDNQSPNSSIDYKFVLERIIHPERDLNYHWRVVSITII